MKRRLAILKVTKDLLLQALHLPPDTDIRAAEADEFNVSLRIEHPDLKEVDEGQLLPSVSPSFHRQPDVVFEGWGQ